VHRIIRLLAVNHYRATHDQIPLLTVGDGRVDTADGRVFPYLFPVPSTWWSQSTAKSRFLGQRAPQYGFTVQCLPVQLPGLDQKTAAGRTGWRPRHDTAHQAGLPESCGTWAGDAAPVGRTACVRPILTILQAMGQSKTPWPSRR
jgi:hypothetical protein